jgi:hypothetical protein
MIYSPEQTMEDKKKNKQLNLEIPESEFSGKYSNLVLVAHSPSEFILDFTQVFPGLPKAKVVSRLILSPQHAKGLLKALNENILKFENQFGEIAMPNIENRPPVQFGPDDKQEVPN